MEATRRTTASDDAGFGLIEIMVSMFLLALLAAAFLPILVTALTTSVRNSTLATATRLVAGQLEELRAVLPNCAALEAFALAPIDPVTDERGTQYQAVRVVAECGSTFPNTVDVRVHVDENGTALSEAVTLFYVGSAGPTP